METKLNVKPSLEFKKLGSSNKDIYIKIKIINFLHVSYIYIYNFIWWTINEHVKPKIKAAN